MALSSQSSGSAFVLTDDFDDPNEYFEYSKTVTEECFIKMLDLNNRNVVEKAIDVVDEDKINTEFKLTNKKMIFEKKKGAFKKERELIDIVQLADVKIHNEYAIHIHTCTHFTPHCMRQFGITTNIFN